jgi:hypothetical protein
MVRDRLETSIEHKLENRRSTRLATGDVRFNLWHHLAVETTSGLF